MIYLIILVLAIVLESLFSGPFLANINTVLAQSIVDGGGIKSLLLTLFGILILIAFLSALQSVSNTYYQRQLTQNMQNEILKHIYHIENYSSLNAGETFAQIDQNVEAYCLEKGEIIKKSARAIFLMIFSGIYILSLSPSLLLFFVVLIGLMIALNYFATAHIQVIGKALAQERNGLVKCQWEMIGNSEIAANLVGEKIVKKYLDTNQSVYQLSVAMSKKKLISILIKRYGFLIVLIAVSVFGGLLTLNSSFTLVELFGIIVLLPKLTSTLFDLPTVFVSYASNQGLKKSIDTIFSQKQYVSENKTNLYEQIHDISCTELAFSFADKCVLQQCSCQFYKGSVSVLVGESGTGKSTLLRLFSRSLSPESGIIKFNALSLDTISRESLWRFVFYAPQDSVVFPTSLRKNITCSQENDSERIHQCLQEANLIDFRFGLDEIVDVETLSVGEKQKIVFARALYTKNAVLLMDEPTSAMDPASEEICMASLRKKTHEENLITILVSHNEACKNFADFVCKMRKGSIEEQCI